MVLKLYALEKISLDPMYSFNPNNSFGLYKKFNGPYGRYLQWVW